MFTIRLNALCKAIFMIIICLLVLLTSGCSAPEGDPEQVLKNYFQACMEGDFETAYELLNEEAKKVISQQDFQLYLELQKELEDWTRFETKFVKEKKDDNLKGFKFKNVVVYMVTEYYTDRMTNENTDFSFFAFVVNDNGVWKVFQEANKLKESISIYFINLGHMHLEGVHRQKDPEKAAYL